MSDPTHFQLRWKKLGGHVHVGVWSGTERDTTHGHNGRLVFRENEWEDFVDQLHPDHAIELIHEEDTNASYPVEVIETRNAGWAWRCHACDITSSGLPESEARIEAAGHRRKEHA